MGVMGQRASVMNDLDSDFDSDCVQEDRRMQNAECRMQNRRRVECLIGESGAEIGDEYGGYLLKRSLRPSRSKPRVKRRVWSSGLDFAVAMR